MAKIGYARVSTKDQNLDLQLAELEKAGCEKVYSEHKSGIKARLELAEAIKYLRKGDILVVCKFDRLGRSLSDLLNIISELHEKGVSIQSLKERPRRSNLYTTSISPFRRYLIASASSKRAFMPLLCSEYTFSQPAFSNSANCKSKFWSFVETLAYPIFAISIFLFNFDCKDTKNRNNYQAF